MMGEEEKSDYRVAVVLLVMICLLLFVVAFSTIQKLEAENNLLRHKIERLGYEKKWIWRNAVEERIEYGEPRIEI